MFKAIHRFLNKTYIKVVKKDNTPKKADLTEDRDRRCRPIAVQLLRYIADRPDIENHIGGHDITREKLEAFYSDVAKDFMENVLDTKELKITDLDYIFRIAMQPLDLLKGKITTTLDNQYNKATDYLWGVDDVDLFLEIDRLKQVSDLIEKEKQAVDK